MSDELRKALQVRGSILERVPIPRDNRLAILPTFFWTYVLFTGDDYVVSPHSMPKWRSLIQNLDDSLPRGLEGRYCFCGLDWGDYSPETQEKMLPALSAVEELRQSLPQGIHLGHLVHLLSEASRGGEALLAISHLEYVLKNISSLKSVEFDEGSFAMNTRPLYHPPFTDYKSSRDERIKSATSTHMGKTIGEYLNDITRLYSAVHSSNPAFAHVVLQELLLSLERAVPLLKDQTEADYNLQVNKLFDNLETTKRLAKFTYLVTWRGFPPESTAEVFELNNPGNRLSQAKKVIGLAKKIEDVDNLRFMDSYFSGFLFATVPYLGRLTRLVHTSDIRSPDNSQGPEN